MAVMLWRGTGRQLRAAAPAAAAARTWLASCCGTSAVSIFWLPNSSSMPPLQAGGGEKARSMVGQLVRARCTHGFRPRHAEISPTADAPELKDDPHHASVCPAHKHRGRAQFGCWGSGGSKRQAAAATPLLDGSAAPQASHRAHACVPGIDAVTCGLAGEQGGRPKVARACVHQCECWMDGHALTGLRADV